MTKEERQAIYSLRDDNLIVIKEADKGSRIVVWDREDYLAEARTQLKDKDVYQEIKGNTAGPLEKIIKSVLRKVRNRKDISVPGRPVISNSGYYTENISAFFECHLKTMAQKVKSYN